MSIKKKHLFVRSYRVGSLKFLNQRDLYWEIYNGSAPKSIANKRTGLQIVSLGKEMYRNDLFKVSGTSRCLDMPSVLHDH